MMTENINLMGARPLIICRVTCKHSVKEILYRENAHPQDSQELSIMWNISTLEIKFFPIRFC